MRELGGVQGGVGEGVGKGVRDARGGELLYSYVLSVVLARGFSVFLFPCWCLEPVLGNPSSALVYFPGEAPPHKSPGCAGSGLAGPDWAFSVGREDHAPEFEHLGAGLSSWGTQ